MERSLAQAFLVMRLRLGHQPPVYSSLMGGWWSHTMRKRSSSAQEIETFLSDCAARIVGYRNSSVSKPGAQAPRMETGEQLHGPSQEGEDSRADA